MKRIALFFLILSLAACTNANNIAVTPTLTVTSTFTVIPTTTLTPTTPPTETPTPTATATEVPVVLQDQVELVDEANVPPEVVTAWKNLKLESAKDYRWGKNVEWGWVLVDKEGRIKFVDYPMMFGVDGKEMVVHMPMYFSQTTGEGNMVLMMTPDQKSIEKGVLELNGSDSQAREFFGWLLEFCKGKQDVVGTDFYKSLRLAADGKMDVVFARGDVNMIPKEWVDKRPSQIVKVNGVSPRMAIVDGPEQILKVLTLVPHIENGKLVIIEFLEPSWMVGNFAKQTTSEFEGYIGIALERSVFGIEKLKSSFINDSTVRVLEIGIDVSKVVIR
jgi:hypothetical protein